MDWIEFSTVYDSDGDELFDCKMPENGERILITVNRPGDEEVQLDTFFDDGVECWLESCYSIIDEVTAWMPLPKPFEPFQKRETG